jgi:hypothetical protein
MRRSYLKGKQLQQPQQRHPSSSHSKRKQT